MAERAYRVMGMYTISNTGVFPIEYAAKPGAGVFVVVVVINELNELLRMLIDRGIPILPVRAILVVVDADRNCFYVPYLNESTIYSMCPIGHRHLPGLDGAISAWVDELLRDD